MAGVITASEPSWTPPFSGLSPSCFRKLITALRREGAEPVRKRRPRDRRTVQELTPSRSDGRPLPGNRNDCRAWQESGARAAVGKTMTIADGGYPGTGLVLPHRRRAGEELPAWKQEHNRSHKRARARGGRT